MGCFGDMEATKQVQSSGSQTFAPWVTEAGKENYDLARSILGAGYQGYTGDRVAPLSANERTASNLIAGKAASGNPYTAEAEGAFRGYGSAPGYQFDFSTIVDPNGPLGPVQGYMNPYLEAVLAPTLREVALQGSRTRQGINANATMAGAFGDSRHGVLESEQRKNEALLTSDVTSKAWADAFAQALGLRSQDMNRLFQTDQAQAAEDKSTLERARTSGIDLQNLDKYNVSRDLGLASALGQTGATERGVEQQALDAGFEEHLRKTGWTNSQLAFLTQLLGGTPKDTFSAGSKTEMQPNNSRWQALGSLASAIFKI